MSGNAPTIAYLQSQAPRSHAYSQPLLSSRDPEWLKRVGRTQVIDLGLGDAGDDADDDVAAIGLRVDDVKFADSCRTANYAKHGIRPRKPVISRTSFSQVTNTSTIGHEIDHRSGNISAK